jgi:hypothetical protein
MAAAIAVGGMAAAAGDASQPFAFLMSDIRIDNPERLRLESDKAIVRVLPAVHRELAIVAAVRVNAPAERLHTWTREIEALQRGKYLPVIGRFSDPPALEDLSGLELDARDVRELQKCRPGKCGVKLAAVEIERLRAQMDESPGALEAVRHEFRQIVLDRARQYLAEGDLGLPPYHDDRVPVSADVEVASLLPRLGLPEPLVPGVADYLQWFPRVMNPNVVDSFLYWSTETLGAKPIASVTHVTLLRGEGPGGLTTLAVSKQVFASHYRDGAMSVTAVTGTGSERYLVYVHRSHIDVLQGVLGGLVRGVIERRVRNEAPAVLHALRARLERGDPPQGGVNDDER